VQDLDVLDFRWRIGASPEPRDALPSTQICRMAEGGIFSALRNLSKDSETKNFSALSSWPISMSENTLLNVSWDGMPWERCIQTVDDSPASPLHRQTNHPSPAMPGRSVQKVLGDVPY